MKAVLRSVAFTVVIAFLAICYTNINVSPFNTKEFVLNTSDYEILDKKLEEMESTIEKRQETYDELTILSEDLQ